MDTAQAHDYGRRDATRDFGNVGYDFVCDLASSAWDNEDCASRTRIGAMLASFSEESGPDWFKEAVERWRDDAEGDDASLARHYAQGYVSTYFALIRAAAVDACYRADADDRAAAEGFTTYEEERSRAPARVLPGPPHGSSRP